MRSASVRGLFYLNGCNHRLPVIVGQTEKFFVHGADFRQIQDVQPVHESHEMFPRNTASKRAKINSMQSSASPCAMPRSFQSAHDLAQRVTFACARAPLKERDKIATAQDAANGGALVGLEFGRRGRWRAVSNREPFSHRPRRRCPDFRRAPRPPPPPLPWRGNISRISRCQNQGRKLANCVQDFDSPPALHHAPQGLRRQPTHPWLGATNSKKAKPENRRCFSFVETNMAARVPLVGNALLRVVGCSEAGGETPRGV